MPDRHLLVAALLLGCAPPDTPASNGAGSSGSGATASQLPAPADGVPPPQAREIYIDSVIVGNPVVVFGRARTFENTVQVRVRDAGGAGMTEVFTTSAGEMGHHNPFSASAWITRLPGDRLIVEAFEYSAKDGSVRSLVADTVSFSVESRSYRVDFPTRECTTTLTVTRQVPRASAVARLLTEVLVAGPTPADSVAGAVRAFPPGSSVRNVTLRDGVLTVDFNERLQNVGGSCAAQAIRVSVTRTLSRLASVQRVVITAGGSEELALQP